LNNEFVPENTISEETIDLELLIGDAEAGLLNVSLYYSNDDGRNFKLFDSYSSISDTISQIRMINLAHLPNSDSAVIKVIVADDSLSSSMVTDNFIKNTPRESLTNINYEVLSGYAESPIQVNVVDSTQLTGDEYIITFDDTTSEKQKYFTVFNATKSTYPIQNEQVSSKNESSFFDGLAFYCVDTLTHIDTDRSHWNPEAPRPLLFYGDKFQYSMIYTQYNGYRNPQDYQIIFYDSIVDTSIADTLYPPTSSNIISAKPISFKVKNIQRNEFIKCVYLKSGTMCTTFGIYFKENINRVDRRTWYIRMYSTVPNDTLPANDTLFIFTNKGISFFDSLRIFDVVNNILDQKYIPDRYKLEQNYPNPFNSSTIIKYNLPTLSSVCVKIYNVLGQEIATLVNEIQVAGAKYVKWDGNDVASGIYFYKIKATGVSFPHESFSQIKKMLLIK
jgi:hypothetical protein